MTEREFIESIDCCFPYSDGEAAPRLIEVACAMSANAAFMVVYELACPPRHERVTRDVLQALLAQVEARLNHPLKAVVLPIARTRIDGNEITVGDAVVAMRKIAAYVDQYNALAIACMSCDDRDGEAERVYEEVVRSWKASSGRLRETNA